MDISSEDMQKRILDWLEEKWKYRSFTCDICEGSDWRIAPMLLRAFSIDMKMACPQIVVTCYNCGNNRYFSALAIGLIEKEFDDGVI